MAYIANLYIDAGTSFSSDVTVQNSDGSIFNLANHTAQGKMSKGHSNANARINFDITVYENDGIVMISLTPAITAQLEDGRWVYDVQITNTVDSTVTRVVEGIITVYPGVVSTYTP
jgi:hypothetical protein